MTHPSANQRLRILVLGYIIRCPLGGMAWSNLHYLQGLARLGHEVVYLEDSSDDALCYDPSRHVTDENPTYGLDFCRATLDRIGLGEAWAYWDQHTQTWHGPMSGAMPDLCKDVDLVLNLAGLNPLRPWLLDVPSRCFVDEDPAFNQIRHLEEAGARSQLIAHNSFLTFAENWGQPDCKVPDDGIRWIPTRQPVVTEVLPSAPPCPDGAYTSVLQLDSYSQRVWEGCSYGLKSTSILPLLDLPARSGVRIELAASGKGELRNRMRAKGWTLINPLGPTRDPWTYEAYMRASKAELGIAKHGYVVSRSGWFSERSVAYLAQGRPVLHEDTGFGRSIASGQGLLAYDDLDSALAGIAEIEAQYEHHCRAAREVAIEEFGYRKVLPAMLAAAMQPVQIAAL